MKLGQVLNPAIPAVTILTPGTLIFELNVGETELPSIKVGQVGGVMFDAIQGKVYPIEIFAVGLSPDTQQGVIIYKVKCKINGNVNDPSGPNPAPGMNGSASIVTEQRPNVVAVLSAVARSRGTEKIVEVITDGGAIETRPVTTGLSDGDNIEIVSGLSSRRDDSGADDRGCQQDEQQADLAARRHSVAAVWSTGDPAQRHQ